MRPRAFDPWPKLTHNQQQRLRTIVAAGPAGVVAGNDHAPAATQDLSRMGMVSVSLGRAYANESGRGWIEAHPVPPVGDGSFNPPMSSGLRHMASRARSAKTLTAVDLDQMRLTAGDVTGVLPSREQMAQVCKAGGPVVA